MEPHRGVDRGGNWLAVVAGEEPEVIGLQRADSQLQRFAIFYPQQSLLRMYELMKDSRLHIALAIFSTVIMTIIRPMDRMIQLNMLEKQRDRHEWHSVKAGYRPEPQFVESL